MLLSKRSARNMTGQKTPPRSAGHKSRPGFGSYYEQYDAMAAVCSTLLSLPHRFSKPQYRFWHHHDSTILARLFSRFGRCKNHQKLLMLGLDGAGKTTLLRKVTSSNLQRITQPTVGFNLESLSYRNLTLIMWDVGGQEKIRALWHHYFIKSQGLIFIVDSSDSSRIPEARKELQKLLNEPDLKEAKLLVYANKQDVSNCLSVADLTDMLDLSLVEDRQWHVQGCSASTGKGVFEGIDWLVEALKPS